MAEVVKKNKTKAAKILGAAVFVLMMLFSLQITTNPDSAGDIDLLGLKVSLFTPSVYNNLWLLQRYLHKRSRPPLHLFSWRRSLLGIF